MRSLMETPYKLKALVGEPDGSHIVSGTISGHRSKSENLGRELADDLLSRGAKEILQNLYNES